MFSVWEVAYYVRVSKRGYAKVGGSSWGNEGHGLLGRNSSVNKLKVQWRIIDFYAVHLRRFSTFFVKCEQEYSVHIWKVDISKFFLRSARSQIFFRAWLGNDESEFGLRAIFTQKSKLRILLMHNKRKMHSFKQKLLLIFSLFWNFGFLIGSLKLARKAKPNLERCWCAKQWPRHIF